MQSLSSCLLFETFVLQVVLGAELHLLRILNVIHGAWFLEIHRQLPCFVKFFELNLEFHLVTQTQSTTPLRFEGIKECFSDSFPSVEITVTEPAQLTLESPPLLLIFYF